MNLDNFSYILPEERIAQRAVSPRDSAKLLILDNIITHTTFSHIIDYLSAGDILVMNETKVLHAKLVGKKLSGSPAEVVLLKKIKPLVYACKIKTKNPHVDVRILFKNGEGIIIAQKSIDEFIIRLSSVKILKDALLPTPPYIKRKVTNGEYQTVYSKKEGSLAAPSAGLHFTGRLLEKIRKKGITIVTLTLHISYGTFKNIDHEIAHHHMDPEWFEISEHAAKTINNRKGKLIAVGTTTLKALESSAKNGKVYATKGFSTLFIYPPFKFHSDTDALITNFHLPKSTLLLLTCAFGGTTRILDAYYSAIKKKYRFYSLGDAMMIEKTKKDHRTAHKK